jgi:hypothetical protein
MPRSIARSTPLLSHHDGAPVIGIDPNAAQESNQTPGAVLSYRLIARLDRGPARRQATAQREM